MPQILREDASHWRQPIQSREHIEPIFATLEFQFNKNTNFVFDLIVAARCGCRYFSLASSHLRVSRLSTESTFHFQRILIAFNFNTVDDWQRRLALIASFDHWSGVRTAYIAYLIIIYRRHYALARVYLQCGIIRESIRGNVCLCVWVAQTIVCCDRRRQPNRILQLN